MPSTIWWPIWCRITQTTKSCLPWRAWTTRRSRSSSESRRQYASGRTRLVNAGRCVESAQKVHNLIQATEELPAETTVLAFADSDACPPRSWLRYMVGRLGEPGVGAVTGYRWFVPQANTVPNLMLYSINSALAGLLGPGEHYVVWGGAWAVRREVFDAIDIRAAWRGTLSDDLVAQRALRESGLGVRFEPNCVVTTPLDCDWPTAFEFAQRQYRIARLYLGRWWLAGLATATLCQLGLWSQLAAALLLEVPAAARALLALSGTGMLLSTLLRAKLRQDMVDIYTPKHAIKLRTSRRFDRLAAPLVAIVNLVVLVSSSVGRRIRWRGISYLVSPAGRSQLIGRRYEPIDDEPVILKFPGTQPRPANEPTRPLRRAA